MDITSLGNLCYLHKYAKFTIHSLDAESKPQIIVHSDLYILLRTQIPLRGLNRGMAEQELDLLEIPAVLAAELGAGAPLCRIPDHAESLKPSCEGICRRFRVLVNRLQLRAGNDRYALNYY
jgi:hypothetical protein